MIIDNEYEKQHNLGPYTAKQGTVMTGARPSSLRLKQRVWIRSSAIREDKPSRSTTRSTIPRRSGTFSLVTSQGSAHEADGYARATGKTGVVIVTSGPGATNTVTGIATAYMDSVPMVVITGQVPRSIIGTDAFQESDIVGITMPAREAQLSSSRYQRAHEYLP